MPSPCGSGKDVTAVSVIKPTQTLGVVGRLFPDIASGAKTSTIRWQERHIVPGPLTFICDDDASQTIDVVVFRCTDLPLHQAAAFVGRAAEWPDDVMLLGMQEHYPEITLGSIVQIVEFYPPGSANARATPENPL